MSGKHTPRPTRLVHMINCLAARRCFDAGQSVQSIASQAHRNPRTVRRWLTVTRRLA